VADETISVLELTYRRLRKAIMSGAFQQGQHLRQEEIAQQLGTSRGPTREALNRLAAEGLVRLRPRRGYVVESLDIDELDDIFDLRIDLESKAGYLATLRRTQKDIDEVEALLKKMERLDINEPSNLREWSELNRAFHARLFEVSGRRQLCRIMINLRDSIERYLRFETSSLPKQAGEHRQIFEAFARGDAAAVSQLSREHCENVHKRLRDRLMKEQGDQPVQSA